MGSDTALLNGPTARLRRLPWRIVAVTWLLTMVATALAVLVALPGVVTGVVFGGFGAVFGAWIIAPMLANAQTWRAWTSLEEVLERKPSAVPGATSSAAVDAAEAKAEEALALYTTELRSALETLPPPERRSLAAASILEEESRPARRLAWATVFVDSVTHGGGAVGRLGGISMLAIRAPRRPANWLQLTRLCMVGATGLVTNLALYTFLVRGLGVDYRLGAAIGWLIALSNNFVLNRHWTFDARSNRHMQALRFLVVSVVTFAFSMFLLITLVDAGLAAVPAQSLALVASVPYGFVGNKVWTFRASGKG
jgi:putative flippase GtrA